MDVYQAFLEGDPVRVVLEECEYKKTNDLSDAYGFTIYTPVGQYLGQHNGIDFRAIVLVCARNCNNSFKPKEPAESNLDITDNEKELINAIMNLLYG